ncbi:Dynamin family protein [Cryptosporidium meleagridis]|uniref:Dynamin family protein n=1 Tax=Cryptosporidium meleagridis TaxID=93969 RepID=A0A2P4Z4R3_9CRYT|nr:Dynamin family protein [Cryptosporidium meleagridis]
MIENNEREFQEFLDVDNPEIEKTMVLLKSMREVENLPTMNLYLYISELLRLNFSGGEIPRIVVLGQQSMGKTTVIDYLIGHPLAYSTNDNGTCCPIVFHISPSEEKDRESYLTFKLESDCLLGSGILNEKEITECLIGGEKVTFEALPEKILEKMKEIKMQTSSQELRIDIRSRGAIEMIIVDLPGLKEDTDGSKITQKILYDEYVRNHPNDIYILVQRLNDNPANWSWKQKPFLLEELGLGKEQAIVVGTRALEYLQKEVKEISNGKQLLERIIKRGPSSGDESGTPIPFFMLELFGLSMEERAIKKMSSRKSAMERRISAGEKAIKEIITQLCNQDHETKIKERILSYFSRDLFEKELRSKFGQILFKQLNSLEKLIKNKSCSIYTCQELPKHQLWREDIILTIRKFAEIVCEMVTGNFNILDFNASQFLDKFGGNLWMNLNDAKETLNDKNLIYLNQNNLLNQQKQKYFTESFKLKSSESIYLRQKRSPYLIGKCISLNVISDTCKKSSSDLIKVEFQYKKNDGLSTGYHIKYLSKSQLVPVKKVQVSKIVQNNYYWLVGFKEQRWNKLIPVQVLSKTGNKIFFKQIDDIKTITQNINEIEDSNNKENTRLEENSVLPRDTNRDVYYLELCEEYALYIDSSWEQIDILNQTVDQSSDILEERTSHPTQVINKKIEFTQDINKSNFNDNPMYDLLLLNEMSFRLIFNWFKKTIKSIKPKITCNEQILCQMLRSVSNVMSASNWQPAVVDLLQMNVKELVIPLVNLTSFACSEALKRIMKAALDVLKKESEQVATLNLLFKSTEFYSLFKTSIDHFCLEKARICSESMKDLVIEQASAIVMDLNYDDLYTDWEKVQQASKSHFEKLKEDLSSLLCTKLYLSFVNDLKKIGIRHKQKLNIESYLKESILDGLLSEKEVIQRYKLDKVMKENEKFKEKHKNLKENYLFILKTIKTLKSNIQI